MKKLILWCVGLFLLSACASTTNPNLNSQMESTKRYFLTTPFTALVDFHVHGNHFVDQNAKPLEGESQSQRHGSKGLMTKKYAVSKGETGYIFYIGQKSDRIIAVGVSSKTGMSAAWNPSNVEIHFSRPITNQDITPASIARSLSSLLVIKGLEPGSELEGMLAELK